MKKAIAMILLVLAVLSAKAFAQENEFLAKVSAMYEDLAGKLPTRPASPRDLLERLVREGEPGRNEKVFIQGVNRLNLYLDARFPPETTVEDVEKFVCVYAYTNYVYKIHDRYGDVTGQYGGLTYGERFLEREIGWFGNFMVDKLAPKQALNYGRYLVSGIRQDRTRASHYIMLAAKLVSETEIEGVDAPVMEAYFDFFTGEILNPETVLQDAILELDDRNPAVINAYNAALSSVR